jgi:thiol-disulfide isomerase/thioredoxin
MTSNLPTVRRRSLALQLGVLGWLALAAWPLHAVAALPAAYGALVVEPLMADGRAEFDLSAALARARRDGKWLYVYLGASDCPYCRKYEAFLASNATELVPHFSKYLIVDLRSALSIGAKALYLKVGNSSLPYAEFQNSLGDERARLLVYPSVWLLDGTLKPLMQMPAGTGTFQTVPEQLEILRLEQ